MLQNYRDKGGIPTKTAVVYTPSAPARWPQNRLYAYISALFTFLNQVNPCRIGKVMTILKNHNFSISLWENDIFLHTFVHHSWSSRVQKMKLLTQVPNNLGYITWKFHENPSRQLGWALERNLLLNFSYFCRVFYGKSAKKARFQISFKCPA